MRDDPEIPPDPLPHLAGGLATPYQPGDYIEIPGVVDPTNHHPDGGVFMAHLDAFEVHETRETSEFRFRNVVVARALITDPSLITAIFKALRTPEGDESESWCYCGRPKFREQNGNPRDCLKGFIFCAYVTISDKTLFEWRLERADPKNPDYPQGYDQPERFELQQGGPIWPIR